MRKTAILILAALFFVVYGIIFFISPDMTTMMASGTGIVVGIYFLILAVIKVVRASSGQATDLPFTATLFLFLFFIPFLFFIFLLLYNNVSVVMIILMESVAFTTFWSFVSIPLAVQHKFEEDKLVKIPLAHYPLISIIVPAYNEERCIAGTIRTLLEAEYPNKEIIVIDDGSTDKTYQIAQSYTRDGVKVVHQVNCGKAVALNHGLKFARGEIIVNVDADSMIARTALIEIVKRFEDPAAIAVAANVKVVNRSNLLLKCQALEYISDINISRRGLEKFGAVIVVPGCLGAFRREAVNSCGGWDVDTVVEDFDTTVKISKGAIFSMSDKSEFVLLPSAAAQNGNTERKVLGIIKASSTALVYTEAPQNLKGLWKQRMRWYYGTFQVLSKHRDIFSNSRFGSLNCLSFPYIFISMIFMPASNIIAVIAGIGLLLAGNFIPVILILGAATMLQFLMCALALALDGEEMKLSFFSPFFVIGYRNILDLIKIQACVNMLTHHAVTWNKHERIGWYQQEVTRKDLEAVPL